MARFLVKIVQSSIVLSGLYFSLPISLVLPLIYPHELHPKLTVDPPQEAPISLANASLEVNAYPRSELALRTKGSVENNILEGASHSSASVLYGPEALESSLATSSHQRDRAALQPTHIVIHLNRREVVLYSGETRIKRYPIAVGRRGWETPIGEFKVVQLRQNPTWINPLTGESIPGGHPENPLGSYWIGFWTDGRNWIGFHGTPDPESIGRAVSHGCIRMYNEDVEELFYQVSFEMPVIVMR